MVLLIIPGTYDVKVLSQTLLKIIMTVKLVSHVLSLSYFKKADASGF